MTYLKKRFFKAFAFAALSSAIFQGCYLDSPTTILTPKEHRPGTNEAVIAAKAKMTLEDSIKLMEKYIALYVDKHFNMSAADAFTQSLQNIGKKPIVTAEGYSHMMTYAVRNGSEVKVEMIRRDVKFSDVVKVVVEYLNVNPSSIDLFNGKGELLLACDVKGVEELIPRTLAAIEILCPNIRKAQGRP